MSQPARLHADDAPDEGELAAAFAELGEAGAAPRPVPRGRRRSDIQELTVPPGAPVGPELPGSIEEAVLAALDQVPRPATLPPPDGDDADDDAPQGGAR